MEKRNEGNLKFINCKRLKKCLETRFKRKSWRKIPRRKFWKNKQIMTYIQESTTWRSFFEEYRIVEQFQNNQTKPKEEFHETNQLKKESKEMNSKVKVPRLQETKVFVTQKSKSNQDGTQHGILQEREMKEETWKKNQKTRNSKLDVKSPWLQQHIEGYKEDSTKKHWFDHGKETWRRR
jgi:hypothetical protein